MTESFHNEDLRYRSLADAAVAAAAGRPIEEVAALGLAAAVAYIELSAGALMLWDDKGGILTRSVIAERDEDTAALEETQRLLLMMRRDYKLNSAYMNLGGNGGRSVFFLPVAVAGRQLGALIGIRRDRISLHGFDEFLKALASVLALAGGQSDVARQMKSARDEGLDELAATVNHHINNILTPLLFSLQLLDQDSESLPEEVRKKLKIIEESAQKIKDVTQRVMSAKDYPSVEYLGDKKMLDLFGEKTGEAAEDEGEADSGENDRSDKE